MLNIDRVRKEFLDLRGNLERRNDPAVLSNLDELAEKDRVWRETRSALEDLSRRRNDLTREITTAKKNNDSADALLAQAKELPRQIVQLEKKAADLEADIRVLRLRIPNILDASVPEGKDASENVVVKKWGVIPPKKEVRHHGQFVAETNLADFERAVKISGTGFFFLKGELALLDLALQRLALDELVKKGFSPIQPPLLLKRSAYEAVAPIEDFENVMYKIEGADQYLIATAEHPLGAMFLDELIPLEQLPIKLAGVSPCFRKEIGKHGLDERGFFRVHQFNKVEQFVFCHPDDSWRIFEELARNSEELLEKLGIPYQRVNVCTGDIGIMAAKKYDIEGWSPREQKYIELMSCSNDLDYQANRLNVRFIDAKGERAKVHTLNNTMIATTRFLRVFIETFQTDRDTLLIPKVLQLYMNGASEIPLPKTV